MMTLEQAYATGLAHMIVSNTRWIYVPQAFAEDYIGWFGISAEERAILLAGPEGNDYWEVWDDVLAHATFVDPNRHVWELLHVEDLWVKRQDVDLTLEAYS